MGSEIVCIVVGCFLVVGLLAAIALLQSAKHGREADLLKRRVDGLAGELWRVRQRLDDLASQRGEAKRPPTSTSAPEEPEPAKPSEPSPAPPREPAEPTPPREPAASRTAAGAESISRGAPVLAEPIGPSEPPEIGRAHV